jgi:uncharacterized membrane protein YtjA (UPF0391 family)
VKPVRTRASWTKRLLLLAAALSTVAVVTDVQEYRDPLRTSSFYASVGVAQQVLLVATAILFISWLYGAYERLPAIGSTPRFKPWWAIAAWFVPILNLIRPKQIVDEVWRAGDEPFPTVPVFVHLWWAAWIVDWLLGNAAGRLYVRAETAGEIRTAALIYLISDVCDVVAAVLGFRIVEGATAGLERQLERG